MARKKRPYRISKVTLEKTPTYVLSINDWNKRGVQHDLIALAARSDADELRFVVEYSEQTPDKRVIDIPLKFQSLQKIRQEVETVFATTDLTIHSRMTTAVAEMLEDARQKILRDLRAQ